MRIKKKHVLLESLLIDVTTEFDDVEKRILKILYKKYGHDVIRNFNQWEVAAWLIESLEIPYDQAYDITKSYYWNHDKLFKEIEPVRKTTPISDLFFSNLYFLIDEFRKKINIDNEPYTNITINIPEDSGVVDERPVHVWSIHNGIGFYLPFHSWEINGRYVTSRERDDRMLKVDLNFKPLSKVDGSPISGYIKSSEYEDMDNNEFIVEVSYRMGEGEGKVSGKLMEFKVPYPRPFSKENFFNMIKLIIDDVLEKIESTPFNLPPDSENLNGDNQPD